MIQIDEIKKYFQGRIALSEPMSGHTWYRIGGPADYYFEPSDKMDAVNIVRYLQKNDFPFIALGKGSNILVHDQGFRGAKKSLLVRVEDGD